MRILSFSGLIPEQICDTVRFTGYPGDRKISHYCGYAADYISQVWNDPAVDGAVFPRSCDSSRVMKSYLEDCGKFLYQFHVPARQDRPAAEVLSATVRDYKNAVERHYGTVLSDAEIRERILLVNERNRALAGIYAGLADRETGSYASYLEMLHALLRKPLREQKVGKYEQEAVCGSGTDSGRGMAGRSGRTAIEAAANAPGAGNAAEMGNAMEAGEAEKIERTGRETAADVFGAGNTRDTDRRAGTERGSSSERAGKRIFLVGSLLCDTGLARTIEESGLKIVGDNLTESKRLFSAPPVEPEGDLYRNIAESMLKNRLSPTQDNFPEILKGDQEELRKKEVQGVIFITQKYCEPYDYLFYAYRQMLEEMGIPGLKLTRADSMDRRRAEAAMEAFADSL